MHEKEAGRGYSLSIVRLAFKRREAGAYLGRRTFWTPDWKLLFTDAVKVRESAAGETGEWGMCAFHSLELQGGQESEVRLTEMFLCSQSSHMGEKAWEDKRWFWTFWRWFLATASNHKWPTWCPLFPQISPPPPPAGFFSCSLGLSAFLPFLLQNST